MNKSLKVLFVLIPGLNPNAGGVQHTTIKLGKYFSNQNIQVGYFSFAKDGHVEPEFGTLFHVSETGEDKNKDNIEELFTVLERFKPDIVINQMPYEASLRNALMHKKEQLSYILIGCLRNSLFCVKNNLAQTAKSVFPHWLFNLINNPLGLNAYLQLHKWKHGNDLKKILDAHDYYILLTPPNQTELEYFIGNYKDHKVLSIPNSIPSVVSKSPSKDKSILYVGRLNTGQKRADLLVEFWEQAFELLPDWNFIIVGDGPYKEKMATIIKDKNLPRIQLEGFKKPEPYYKNASIFIMPSAFEGFPNVLLEAHSYGVVPVVFNSYPALPWIVQDQENALLVPPYNVNQMAKNVVELANDESKRIKMASAAIENAKQFTIDKVGKIWMDFFQEIKGLKH